MASADEGVSDAEPDPLALAGEPLGTSDQVRFNPDFEEFFSRIHPQLIKFAWRALGNKHDAEEAAANTMAPISIRWKQIKSPDAYAWKVVRREIQSIRSTARESRAMPTAPEQLAQLPDTSTDFETLEGREWVDQQLDMLPCGQSAALRMQMVEQLSARETADRLGKSPEAVRQSRAAGLRTLRQRLMGRENR